MTRKLGRDVEVGDLVVTMYSPGSARRVERIEPYRGPYRNEAAFLGCRVADFENGGGVTLFATETYEVL